MFATTFCLQVVVSLHTVWLEACDGDGAQRLKALRRGAMRVAMIVMAAFRGRGLS